MNRVRLLCYNIHGGRDWRGRRDLSRIREVMDRLDVDIGVFQEVETRLFRTLTPVHVSELAGESRPHHLPGKSMADDTGWYGNLIVSRFPLLDQQVHPLETKEEFEPRNAVDALIDAPFGPLRVIGTHLSLSYLERFSEANNLLRLMKSVDREAERTRTPLLLMGDMNEWQPRSKLLTFLDSHMTPLRLRATFPAYLPLFRLDRVWHEIPAGFQVTAHRLSGGGFRTISDHLPLLIEVQKS